MDGLVWGQGKVPVYRDIDCSIVKFYLIVYKIFRQGITMYKNVLLNVFLQNYIHFQEDVLNISPFKNRFQYL